MAGKSNESIAIRILEIRVQREIPDGKPAVVFTSSILCRKDVKFGCPEQAEVFAMSKSVVGRCLLQRSHFRHPARYQRGAGNWARRRVTPCCRARQEPSCYIENKGLTEN